MLKFNDIFRITRSSSEELTETALQNLRGQAAKELARRSFLGAVIVPLCFLLIIFASDFVARYPIPFVILLSAFLFTAAARIFTIRQILDENSEYKEQWLSILSFACLIMALTWGSSSAIFMVAYKESSHGMLVIIISAGMGAAAVANFCAWRQLASWYLSLLFIPNIACILWLPSAEIIPVLLAMTFFVYYMILQVRRWNEEYWQSLLTAHLFENQAVRLSEINIQLTQKIAEQKRFQKELEVERRKMRDLFDHSHAAIIICDLAGKVVEINATTLRLFAIAKESIEGSSILTFLSATDLLFEKCKRIWRSAVAGEEIDFEWQRRKTGNDSIVFLQINLRKVVWYQQEIIFVTIRDITVRKEAEKERDTFRSSLEKSEEYLQAILQNIAVPIYCKNLQGKYLSVNKQFELLAQASAEEIMGRSDAEIFPVSIASHLSNHDDTVRKNGTSIEYESAMAGGEGEGPTWLIHKFPLKDQKNNVYATGGICTDITILKNAYTSAKMANEAKSEFLANMSHELRTPMHSILSFARLGLKRLDSLSREKLESYLKMIVLSGEQLLELLTDLLDLSSLESRKMSYRMHKRNITEDLDAVIHEFQAIAEEKKVLLSYLQTDLDVLLRYDRARICQVIRNLLANAVKFSSPDNEIRISLESDHLHVDGQRLPAVKILVADHGAGIPEGERDAVFEKFVQSSITRTGAGGAGLGLAICKQIIEDHQGKIWAEANPAGGTVLAFSLPVY